MTEIGKEYGAALFMLACENDAKHEYTEGLRVIGNAASAEPEYFDFLSSPGIPVTERLSAIEAAFSKKVPEHVLSFLQLLCEKGRLPCFYDAIKEYSALLDASEHISVARVTSAVELTDGEKDKLKSRLESFCKCQVNIEYLIDKKILGGLTVEVDGSIMDGSLRHRLREVKEVMKK